MALLCNYKQKGFQIFENIRKALHQGIGGRIIYKGGGHSPLAASAGT